MKKILFSVLMIALVISSCDLILGRRIKGNGHIVSEQRTVNTAKKIKLAGSYDVELSKGATSVKIESDDNIIPYIVTEEEDGWLVIKSKEMVNLRPSSHIKVFISTEELDAVSIAGSGNIVGKDKFTGGERLELKIAGSGDINIDVNAPSVKSEIAGSGNIIISGETKDEEIHIAGHGDYKGETLKAENAEVHIAGSGNVKVFADNRLTIHIAGSGSVYYKGNPRVEQHVAGSGDIKQIP
jgi:hypothetical protein